MHGGRGRGRRKLFSWPANVNGIPYTLSTDQAPRLDGPVKVIVFEPQALQLLNYSYGIGYGIGSSSYSYSLLSLLSPTPCPGSLLQSAFAQCPWAYRLTGRYTFLRSIGVCLSAYIPPHHPPPSTLPLHSPSPNSAPTAFRLLFSSSGFGLFAQLNSKQATPPQPAPPSLPATFDRSEQQKKFLILFIENFVLLFILQPCRKYG